MGRFDDDNSAFRGRRSQNRKLDKRQVPPPPKRSEPNDEEGKEATMAKFKIYCIQVKQRRYYRSGKQAAIKFANEKRRTEERGTLITVTEVLTADQGHKTMLINALNNDGWVLGSTVIRSYVVK